MKQITKLIATILIVALFPSIQVSADSKEEITLTVSGDGPTKEDALKNALRTAIEQAYGAFVSANTTILNDELVKDEIVTVSNGSIKEYNEVSSFEKPDGKGYMTTVNATVSLPHLITYAKNHGSECEFAGNSFGMELKLFNLQKENELKALYSLIPIIEEIAKNTMTWELEISEPYIPDVRFERDEDRFHHRKANTYIADFGQDSNKRRIKSDAYPELKNFLMDVCENADNYCGFDVKIYWVPSTGKVEIPGLDAIRNRPGYEPEYEFKEKIEFVETLKDYLSAMSLDRDSYYAYKEKGYSGGWLGDRDSGYFDTENYKCYVYYSRLDQSTLDKWVHTLEEKLISLKNNFEIVDANGAISNFYHTEMLPNAADFMRNEYVKWKGVKQNKDHIIGNTNTYTGHKVFLFGGSGMFNPFVLAGANHMICYNKFYKCVDIDIEENYNAGTRRIRRSKPSWNLSVIVPISESNKFTSFKIQPKH